MLTVSQAARRADRNAETVRRWIRGGRLRASKVGTQHVIDEADLMAVLADEDSEANAPLPLLPGWGVMTDGRPLPDVAAALRRSRARR